MLCRQKLAVETLMLKYLFCFEKKNLLTYLLFKQNGIYLIYAMGSSGSDGTAVSQSVVIRRYLVQSQPLQLTCRSFLEQDTEPHGRH